MSIRRGVAMAGPYLARVATGNDFISIAPAPAAVHSFAAMQLDYDAVIIGGAFSGAATALMIKRQQPNARVLIIEKSAEFDRKVGESRPKVSSCYMTRLLGLTNYLGHHHLAKQGLRMWFSNAPDQQFDDCVEIGAHYQSRLPNVSGGSLHARSAHAGAGVRRGLRAGAAGEGHTLRVGGAVSVRCDVPHQ
jgi:choline dehydrogenase-like flavoprotein